MWKKVETVLIIKYIYQHQQNYRNNILSPQIIEHNKRDHDIFKLMDIQALDLYIFNLPYV